MSPTTYVFLEAVTLSRVGRYREVEKKIRQGIELSLHQGNIPSSLDLEFLAAHLELERGNYAAAIAIANRLTENTPEDQRPPWFARASQRLVVTAEARAGNVEAARDRYDGQADIFDAEDPIHKSWSNELRGEIALASGNLAAAETAFSEAQPELKMSFNKGSGSRNIWLNDLNLRDGLARLKKAQGDLAGAIADYRELLTTDISSK